MAKNKKPDQRLKVTLTKDERNDLEILAKAQNQSLATTLRKAAFLKMENYKALEKIRPTLENLLYEAGKQGSNLNQMARKLNAMNKTDTPRDEIFNAIKTARETAEQFNDIRQKILEIL